MSDPSRNNQTAAPAKSAAVTFEESRHNITPCDFRRSVKLSDAQQESLSELHREFATQVGTALASYLRSEMTVSLDSVQQIIFKDFLSDASEPEHVVPLELNGFPQSGLVHMGLNSACSLIELLLGGKVLRDSEKRALTEIDHHLLNGVLKIIARELEASWQVPGLTVSAADHALKPAALHASMAENEKLLSLRFSIHIGEMTAQFVVLLPALFGNTLVRTKADTGTHSRQHEESSARGIRENILECPFSMMAAIPNIKVTVRDLISLAPGSVLELRISVKTPCSLMIEGEPQFEIAPVRSGLQRAAQLLRPVQQTASKRWK